ncbi:SDR family oxidoreductase [Roseomonas stagni]|uniref:SDR family oxidoreductase n=1 Tax=Falsiroseomonas algicola TaxID=2716930 RepID=A0A6M1LH52_9PROT|nr:SDR family oxidoreductase [Falsiroseomonas algicola]NGM19708.1 SDR family oxidoreductase [Falsiroseomonas algicola]
MNNPQTLAGRIILVTGAARGVGRAIAEACAAAGARLVVADVLEEAGEATAAALRAGGAAARFLPVDLGDPDSVARMGEAIAAEEGVLHGLVNNAAIATGIGGPEFDTLTIETWDRAMRVNVRGTWLVTRACAGMLQASGSGRIVNVASDTALWGAPRLLAYTSSKGAVLSMTRSLARELGPRGIGITAVAPGIMRCEATEYVPEARHRLYEEGRAVPGPQVPEDIAATIVFLLTPGAIALTGQTLPVNAGFVFA